MRRAVRPSHGSAGAFGTWVIWLAVFPVCAAGTESTPSADGPDRTRYLTLDPIDAFLEFEAELSHTRVEASRRRGLRGQRSQSNRDRIFEERIGLTLGGTIIDPAFITFGGEVSLALNQSRFLEDVGSGDQTDRDSGYLVQYDILLSFLQGKRISGSAHLLRLDDRITRRFQPTLRERRTGLGMNWVYVDDNFPMEFSYDYLETDRTGNTRSRDDEHYTESTFRYAVDWNITLHHRIKFSYDRAETKQEYQGSVQPFDTTRNLVTFEHQLEFGPDARHEFRTLVHWQEESGEFARDLFEIGPQLNLRHRDNLQTQYKYQFDRERYEGIDIETHRLDFVMTHQLYSNLSTTVNLFGLYEDVQDDVQTTQYGALLDWQYNRRNRFGHLNANLALAYDTEDVRGGNGDRLVLNEAHGFRDPIAVTLRNRNIIPMSIVVTDTSNRRVFRVGIDYVLVFQGNVVRLVRRRTGQIADGDTILVDYLYRTPAGGKLDTIRADFELEQRFSNGLKPYYRLSYRNQEDDASTGFFRRADRTDHHRIGVTYDADRYSLGTEYEIFDDTIDPYDAYHLDGMVHLIRSGDESLDASAHFAQLFFEGGVDSRDVILLDLELDHRRRLTDALSAVERVAYRLENDSVDGVTNSWDATAGLEYVMGDLFGELTLDYNRLALPDSEEDDFGLYLRIRRELPHVFARR